MSEFSPYTAEFSCSREHMWDLCTSPMGRMYGRATKETGGTPLPPCTHHHYITHDLTPTDTNAQDVIRLELRTYVPVGLPRSRGPEDAAQGCRSNVRTRISI